MSRVDIDIDKIALTVGYYHSNEDFEVIDVCASDSYVNIWDLISDDYRERIIDKTIDKIME